MSMNKYLLILSNIHILGNPKVKAFQLSTSKEKEEQLLFLDFDRTGTISEWLLKIRQLKTDFDCFWHF